jgi:3-deoxy-D-manno-octulosonate 8-phosphate phosphatase (KDO 8-P phosphatase)
MLLLDVDGVLTDGGLYYDSEGNISKRFNVQDGLGIKLAQAAGLEVGVITGLDSPAVERRVRELGIEEYFAGHLKKMAILEDIQERKGLTLEQIAYVGDDWVDAAPMRAVGLAMAVTNAQPEILELAHWVSRHKGGHGAVREAVRFILLAQGRLDAIWREWGF